MELYYHYTTIKSLPSILQNGLTPDADGLIYLTRRKWGEFVQVDLRKRTARLTVRINDARRVDQSFFPDEFVTSRVSADEVVAVEVHGLFDLTKMTSTDISATCNILATIETASTYESLRDGYCGDVVAHLVNLESKSLCDGITIRATQLLMGVLERKSKSPLT